MKHLNIKTLGCTAAAMLFPVWQAAFGGVNLSTPVQTPSGTTVDSGVPVTVAVAAESTGGSLIDAVLLAFTHDDGVRQWSATNAMEWIGATTYSAAIPPLAAGTVEYQVVCRYDTSERVTSSIGIYTIGSEPGIATGRYMPFTSAWARDGTATSTNWSYNVNAGSWYGSGVLRESIAQYAPPGWTTYFMLMLNIVGSYIESPTLTGGLGTIYYTSRIQPNQTGKIYVQVSTHETPGEGDWETVRILDYLKASDPGYDQAEPVLVNRADVKRVRFWRAETSPFDKSADNSAGAIAFDNLVLSPPPADMLLAERLRNPGYPSQDQEIHMRLEAGDTNPDAPTHNHRATLFYQWVRGALDRPVAGAWLSTNMLATGLGYYEGVIPQHAPGFIHYYYKLDFDGYYYGRDPDGAGSETEPFNSEKLSPNYWSAGDSLPGVPQFYSRLEVRPYRSEYGQMWLEAEPSQATVPMELVEDEVWQGITLVTGLESVRWYFKGYNRYTNDATAYSSEPVVWGDNDQGFPNPPIGGFAEVDATNSIVAEMTYDGFLMMRLNTVGRDYIAKRAVYQNFNEWQASKIDFEESLGLYAVKKYDDNFDAWPADGYTADLNRGEPFQNDTPSAAFELGFLQTANGWARFGSRVVLERKINTLSTTIPNRALVLSGLHQGQVGNTGDSLTRGMRKLDYAVRASISDTHAAVYTNTAGFGQTQTITAKFEVSQLSPEFPYVSVLFNYQPSPYLGPSFYEFRLIQHNEATGGQTDNYLRGEVWRWNAGSATPVKIGTTQNYGAGKLIAEQKVVIDVSGTAPVTMGITVGATLNNFSDNTAGRLSGGGTVGFMAHDAEPRIISVVVSSNNGSLNQASFATPAGWYQGGLRADGGGHRWTAVGNRLTRLVPPQTISIWTAPRRPGATRPDLEDLVKHSEVQVATLAYSLKTVDLKAWDEGFVEIRFDDADADADVAVDDPRLYPWRANTREQSGAKAMALDKPYYEWSTTDDQYEWLRNQRGWAVLEGMVTNSTTLQGRDVHFERSRANPDLYQALVSPVLTNGIGTINFVYTVDGGRAIYAIERTDEGVEANWTPVAVFTNVVGETGARYVAIRENFRGRICIRLLPESDFNARLMIDDAEARDYPPRDDSTWQAYNVLVTDQQTSRLLTGQSCYLNNSSTEGVAGVGVSLGEHQPFVQTPSVGTGIGEISFRVRTWSGTVPTNLRLMAAPTPDTPDEQWVLITNLLVEAGVEYFYFSNPSIYDLDNHVLRIYGDTNGADRVCIDNVLMAEPVRAGYEFEAVRLVPEQPLVGAPVAVEADIGRFLMNPLEIKVYLSYHIGTNVWGATNWWTRQDTPGSKRIQLEPIAEGSRTYRTPQEALIPARDTDEVVQYYVWGTHSEIAENQVPIFQNTALFVNPAWYAPIDLNAAYGSQGRAPYYIVYSCPPGSVWVNEVNALFPYTQEYIELIGPAQADLGGWRLELVNHDTLGIFDSCTIPGSFALGSKTNGWGFYVWGDVGVPSVNQTFSQPLDGNVPYDGGFRLIRSCGAVEELVCWGATAKDSLEPLGYSYASYKDIFGDSPLGLRTRGGVELGDMRGDFYWPEAGYGAYTPGNVNTDQRLADISQPSTGYFALISAIGPHGLQNGLATFLDEQVASGSPAEVNYTAAPWYRIATFESNGATVPAAIGESGYLWSVASMSGDISNHVTFAAVSTYGENVPVAWLANWSESAVAAGDNDELGVDDEYLLNTDPTADTTASLTVTDIGFNAGTLEVTVRLERDLTALGDINGTLVLQSCTDLQTGVFAEVANTAITGAEFGLGGDEHTYSFPGVTDTSRFYRAVIKGSAP